MLIRNVSLGLTLLLGMAPALTAAVPAPAKLHRDRALGCLLGLAVGDAMGTTHEFQPLQAPAFPRLATGPLTAVQGGGPFRCSPGEVTDDTQMAITLARVLQEKKGPDPVLLGRRYGAWARRAFDIGTVTRGALARIEAGVPATEAGVAQWVASGYQASGNGSLMRTAPIGVWFARDPQARREASLGDSAITHADPRCQLACAAFNAAVARAVLAQGDPGLAQAMVQAAEGELPEAARRLTQRMPQQGERIRQALEDLRQDLACAGKDDPQLYGTGPDALHLHQQMGFVRVAFRLGFWELLHAPGYQAALVDVVNRGGDADTNGAITGALLGACHGLQAIPAPWLKTVEKAHNRLGAAYHPAYFRAWVRQLP